MTESEVTQIIEELQILTGKVDQIYQGLYGIPHTEDKGICGDLKTLKKDYYEFKRRVLVIFAFSAGGGGLLGAAILKLIGG